MGRKEVGHCFHILWERGVIPTTPSVHVSLDGARAFARWLIMQDDDVSDLSVTDKQHLADLDQMTQTTLNCGPLIIDYGEDALWLMVTCQPVYE